MNDIFRKNILDLYGDNGKKWLDSLPQLIDTYNKKWHIEAYSPYDLSYNYVAPAKRTDGTPAVLKIGYPKDSEIKGEINALVLINGYGAEKILEADRENAIMLLEQIFPGIPLSKIDDDETETRILAKVMKKIRKPLPKNHNFITLPQWITELREYAHILKGYPSFPVPSWILSKALKLFEELITTSKTQVFIHGDLHHNNVLSSDRDNWLAIDPKGIAAEAEFETAALIRNPYERIKKSTNLEELFRKRINILSSELNFDPERIRKWCYAQTVLSGLWSRDNNEYANHALKVAQALDNIKVK